MPGKNIAVLAGRPLIAWTIEAALRAKSIQRVIVTTDDPAIAEVSKANGAEIPFLRPAELATSTAPGIGAVLHAMNWAITAGTACDWVTVLQPTSPLRTADDIDAAMQLAAARGAESVIAVSPVKQHPQWMRYEDDAGFLRSYLGEYGETPQNRQQLAPLFHPNGAIFSGAWHVIQALGTFWTSRTVAYVMPAERSVDIDSSFELRLSEFLLTQHPGKT